MPIEIESPEELGYNTILYNLAESSISDKSLSDYEIRVDELLKLAYFPHKGNDLLRTQIVEDSHALNANHVLTTSGAIMALFIVNTTLLSKEDHLIVIRPNYASNIETPKAIGCEISYIDLHFEEQWQIDPDLIKQKIKPNTRLISLTSPHNPTGQIIHANVIESIIKIAEEKNIFILMDETYRELNFNFPLNPYFAEMSEKIISVCSMSKAYGVPGIRVGWIICQNQNIMTKFLAAKEQIILANAAIEEHIALEILSRKHIYRPQMLSHLKANFAILQNWIKGHDFLEWIEPQAGAVGFVRVKKQFSIDHSLFTQNLYEKYNTLIGFGHWFEQESRYMRIGFGYPEEKDFIKGLNNLELAVMDSLIKVN